MKYLILLLALSGCRTAQTTVEVQAVVGEEKPQVHVVAKVSVL
jgi:hypothetical protein